MNFKKYKDLIRYTYLFNQLSLDNISTLFSGDQHQVRHYGKNSIIYLQNEVCNTVDIILDGGVDIQKIDESGDILTIVTYTSGDIMGANLAFSKTNRYPMTVISSSKTTILHMNKNLILDLCQADRGFLIRFLESLSHKALILTDKIKFISMKTIRDKIIEFLTYEYHLQNSPVIKLQVTKKELAERFGVQRPSLFRELRKMKEDGLIDYDSRSVKIMDMDLLKKHTD
ncbi:MAG: Crp/Fnr family transcriptional regulator [Tissierellia bacterium]|nr:Crp/Fnr family transcriptional regulator [Tissierellia bacterium]